MCQLLAPCSIGEAADPPLLHSQLLASGPFHQHLRASCLVTFEFLVSVKAALQETGGSTGWKARSPCHMVCITAPWESGQVGVLLS